MSGACKPLKTHQDIVLGSFSSAKDRANFLFVPAQGQGGEGRVEIRSATLLDQDYARFLQARNSELALFLLAKHKGFPN